MKVITVLPPTMFCKCNTFYIKKGYFTIGQIVTFAKQGVLESGDIENFREAYLRF